jgi:hypothetical protein
MKHFGTSRLLAIMLLLGSGCDPVGFRKETELLDMNRYVGTWRLDPRGVFANDSLALMQRLVLSIDSSYTSTFSLITFDTQDTSRLSNPYRGYWYTAMHQIDLFNAYTGIEFTLEGNRYPSVIWLRISGGRADSSMLFIGTSETITWRLVN